MIGATGPVGVQDGTPVGGPVVTLVFAQDPHVVEYGEPSPLACTRNL